MHILIRPFAQSCYAIIVTLRMRKQINKRVKRACLHAGSNCKLELKQERNVPAQPGVAEQEVPG